MIRFLRFVGVANAAVWFGAAVFLTFAAAPVFFTEELKQVIPAPYNGFVAQLMLQRYFEFQLWCGLIAAIHLVAEWLYMGKKLKSPTLYLVLGLVLLGLLGRYWLVPRMKELHATAYNVRVPPAQAHAARSSFKIWHGFSQGMNLLMLAGLGVHLWRVSQPPSGGGSGRFNSGNKFRG